MSERIYAFLLHLYPARFRERYKEEAVQLYRDLYRHRTGLLPRARLWVGLLADLAFGLPQAYRNTYVSPAPAPFAQGAQGMPMFRLLERQPVRSESFLLASALTLMTLGALYVLLSHPTVYRAEDVSDVSKSPIESVLERLNQPASTAQPGNESQRVSDSFPSNGQKTEVRKEITAQPQQTPTAARNGINPSDRYKVPESVVKNPEANPRTRQQSGKAPVAMPQYATQGGYLTAADGTVVNAHTTLVQRWAIQPPPIEIQRATVIAFGPPATRAEVTDADASDSQFDLDRLRQTLDKAGIAFLVVRAHSFRIRLGSETSVFHPKSDVGYYLIAPGKKPLIEYGAITDSDLLRAAKSYFASLGQHGYSGSTIAIPGNH